MPTLAITIEHHRSTTYYVPEPKHRTIDPNELAHDLITLPDHVLAHIPHQHGPSSTSVTHAERLDTTPPERDSSTLLRFDEHGTNLPRAFAQHHAQHFSNIPHGIIDALTRGPQQHGLPFDQNDPYWGAWLLTLALARYHDGRALALAPNLDLLLITPRDHAPHAPT